jgi:23S rRNA (guanine745-N1)-methyltransferase
MLICPVCCSDLKKIEHSYVCDSKHVFDISKEGYVNLLLSQKGVPKLSGDTKLMVNARRRFLSKGYFEFLIAPLTQLACKAFPVECNENIQHNILDVGSGDGYFIAALAEKVPTITNLSLNCFGLELSKDALKAAAAKHSFCQFFRANVHWQVPVRSQSVTLITGIFAPRNFTEYSRILTKRGMVIIVIPTSMHLYELREFFDLLQIDDDKEEKIVSAAKGFKLVESLDITRRFEISTDDINDLLDMTPNHWHRRELNKIPTYLTVTFSFRILSFMLES